MAGGYFTENWSGKMKTLEGNLKKSNTGKQVISVGNNVIMQIFDYSFK